MHYDIMENEMTSGPAHNGILKSNVMFGQWLLDRGLITKNVLTEALDEQQCKGGRLGEVLEFIGALKSDVLIRSLGEFMSVDSQRLDDLSGIDMKTARQIPENIAKRFCLIAASETDNMMNLVMADPLDVVARDSVKRMTGCNLRIVISSRREILAAIESIYHGTEIQEQQLRDLVDVDIEEDSADEALESANALADISEDVNATAAPVIRFVNLLLSHAVKSRASDIHIEPQDKSMSVRMRIDGILRDMVPPRRKMQSAVIARIKILSEMNIAERRLPQDGRFKIKAKSHEIDVRVSSIPTIYGEKIVMRILDKEAVNHDLNKIGIEGDLLKDLKSVLTQPHGIVIVTGPTGSGKSTTLYSALNYLRDPKKNITTVEDPVEYRLAGINQIQVKQEINLDFAVCLRAILRQDPDIVLIGEIRDKETMEIAMKASLTGHLVLSTFHTNDAPSAISRLKYMGLEPYMLASTLNFVVAQRLLRTVCPKCKQKIELDDETCKRLRIDPQKAAEHSVYEAKGCKACGGSGYKGRIPIFEFMMVDHALREKITADASESEIRAHCRQEGYGGLLESGVERLLAGLTTTEEVLRVTFTGDSSN